jgi:outer membrane protein assembly factor BamB
MGAPALGDIDKDNKIDIVAVSFTGKIAALSNSGAKKWEFDTKKSSTFSSPMLTDIDGDGNIGIIVHTGRLFVLKGTDGTEKYNNVFIGFDTTSTPAIGDIDNDGIKEIVFGSGYYLYAYSITSGKLNKDWQFKTTKSGGYCASPLMGDIDKDGVIEVVYPVKNDGIYSVEGTTGTKEWYTPFGQGSAGLTSSPALGDVDSDGNIEVVCGGTCDKKIYSFDGKTGNVEWTYTCGNIIESSCTIADVDGDGVMEVLCGAHDAYLHCLNGKTGALEWKFYSPGSDQKVVSSPSIADCTGDGYVEIVFGSNGGKLFVLGTLIPEFSVIILPTMFIICIFLMITKTKTRYGNHRSIATRVYIPLKKPRR